ncbi:hypothetical protein C9I57_25275 [Trinickia symbiotica]|uniref:Uncharacterized protein n=1 Tax=Trinickia symbiotica TaxID=863227 RepID=A0A2T3XMV1_9BURK|nr:hypothetical protein C9I57_25275 [Trinickia symbiotica]
MIQADTVRPGRDSTICRTFPREPQPTNGKRKTQRLPSNCALLADASRITKHGWLIVKISGTVKATVGGASGTERTRLD